MLIQIEVLERIEHYVKVKIGDSEIFLKVRDFDLSVAPMPVFAENINRDVKVLLAERHMKKALEALSSILDRDKDVGENAQASTGPEMGLQGALPLAPAKVAPTRARPAEGPPTPRETAPVPAMDPRIPAMEAQAPTTDPMLVSLQEHKATMENLPVKVNNDAGIDGNTLTVERVTMLVKMWEAGDTNVVPRLAGIPPAQRMKFVKLIPDDMRRQIVNISSNPRGLKTGFLEAEEYEFLTGTSASPEGLGINVEQTPAQVDGFDLGDADLRQLFESKGWDPSALDKMKK